MMGECNSLCPKGRQRMRSEKAMGTVSSHPLARDLLLPSAAEVSVCAARDLPVPYAEWPPNVKLLECTSYILH